MVGAAAFRAYRLNSNNKPIIIVEKKMETTMTIMGYMSYSLNS